MQCYKFETQTDMEVADQIDLERASRQGSILEIKVNGTVYGQGGFRGPPKNILKQATGIGALAVMALVSLLVTIYVVRATCNSRWLGTFLYWLKERWSNWRQKREIILRGHYHIDDGPSPTRADPKSKEKSNSWWLGTFLYWIREKWSNWRRKREAILRGHCHVEDGANTNKNNESYIPPTPSVATTSVKEVSEKDGNETVTSFETAPESEDQTVADERIANIPTTNKDTDATIASKKEKGHDNAPHTWFGFNWSQMAANSEVNAPALDVTEPPTNTRTPGSEVQAVPEERHGNILGMPNQATTATNKDNGSYNATDTEEKDAPSSWFGFNWGQGAAISEVTTPVLDVTDPSSITPTPDSEVHAVPEESSGTIPSMANQATTATSKDNGSCDVMDKEEQTAPLERSIVVPSMTHHITTTNKEGEGPSNAPSSWFGFNWGQGAPISEVTTPVLDVTDPSTTTPTPDSEVHAVPEESSGTILSMANQATTATSKDNGSCNAMDKEEQTAPLERSIVIPSITHHTTTTNKEGEGPSNAPSSWFGFNWGQGAPISGVTTPVLDVIDPSTITPTPDSEVHAAPKERIDDTLSRASHTTIATSEDNGSCNVLDNDEKVVPGEHSDNISGITNHTTEATTEDNTSCSALGDGDQGGPEEQSDNIPNMANHTSKASNRKKVTKTASSIWYGFRLPPVRGQVGAITSSEVDTPVLDVTELPAIIPTPTSGVHAAPGERSEDILNIPNHATTATNEDNQLYKTSKTEDQAVLDERSENIPSTTCHTTMASDEDIETVLDEGMGATLSGPKHAAAESQGDNGSCPTLESEEHAAPDETSDDTPGTTNCTTRNEENGSSNSTRGEDPGSEDKLGWLIHAALEEGSMDSGSSNSQHTEEQAALDERSEEVQGALDDTTTASNEDNGSCDEETTPSVAADGTQEKPAIKGEGDERQSPLKTDGAEAEENSSNASFFSTKNDDNSHGDDEGDTGDKGDTDSAPAPTREFFCIELFEEGSTAVPRQHLI